MDGEFIFSSSSLIFSRRNSISEISFSAGLHRSANIAINRVVAASAI